MNLKTEISVGEFLDKVTILEIKSERINDPSKLENINNELNLLRQLWKKSPFSQQDVVNEVAALKAINEELWEIEDDIRLKESSQEFDDTFIQLARAVYVTNDQRAAIKKKINLKLGSELVEEKSYADYRAKA